MGDPFISLPSSPPVTFPSSPFPSLSPPPSCLYFSSFSFFFSLPPPLSSFPQPAPSLVRSKEWSQISEKEKNKLGLKVEDDGEFW